MRRARFPTEIAVEPLTVPERVWLVKLNDLLQSCPTSRLACATTGGPDLTFFDSVEERKNPFDADRDGDFCPWLERTQRIVAVVHSTFEIGSTAA